MATAIDETLENLRQVRTQAEELLEALEELPPGENPNEVLGHLMRDLGDALAKSWGREIAASKVCQEI